MDLPQDTLFDGLDLTDYQTLLDKNLMVSFEPQPQQGPLQSERYDLKELLGEGGMGEILLAKDKYLFRRVAYKHIRPELAQNPKLINIFYKEAQITSQLEHPGVIPVYSMEQPSDRSLAYAMKWVRGQTLKEEIQSLQAQLKAGASQEEWQKTFRHLLGVFVTVCDTLYYAHQKGVVHRDLKPTNIMLGGYQEVYVLDWGVASSFQQPPSKQTAELQVQIHNWDPDSEERTQLGSVVGTPRYMSPEQASGQPGALQPASDIFALGLILFELTYLKPAFQASTLEALLERVKANQKASFDSEFAQVKVRTELQKIIARATATDPKQRYNSAGELAQDIRAYLADHETQVAPDSGFAKALRWTRHHPQHTLVGILLMLLLSSGVVGGSLLMSQRTIQNNRIRRIAVNRLLTEATLLSQRLDDAFSQYENLLSRLVAHAAEVAQRGSLRDVKPPAPSTSTEPDYQQASWVTPDQQPPLKLLPLQDSALVITAMSLDPAADPMLLLKQQRLGTAPIQWSTVSFEGGPQMTYPGNDPSGVIQRFRQLPAAIRTAYAPIWGQTNHNLINVYQGVYSDSYAYLGWAGLQIDLWPVLQKLDTSKIPGFVALRLLLLEQGPAQTPQLSLGQSQTPLPEALFAQMKQQSSGYFEAGSQLFVHQQLGSLPWTLLLETQRAPVWEASQDELR